MIKRNKAPATVLFIHGMGRSPLSGWPMLRRLRQAGLNTASFGYSSRREDFAGIVARLASRLEQLAASGDYILIGHSLGGVLLRAALASLAPDSHRPRHVFLLGSPVRPARLAGQLSKNPVFQLLTGDNGQLLASAERMRRIPPLTVPATAILGTRGLNLRRGHFGNDANDGVVAVSEATADWIRDEIHLPVVHTLLPSSRLVSTSILHRLQQRRLA